MFRLILVSFVLIISSFFGMAQTVSPMTDYAAIIDGAGDFPKQIDLEKTSIFHLTNDIRISVTSKKEYDDQQTIKLQLEDESFVADFKIDPDDFEKSHPLANPTNQAFGPFLFTLESPTMLKVDCNKFNVPNFLNIDQPANIVGLLVTFKGTMRAHFTDNSAKAFYQISLQEGEEEKEMQIDSDSVDNPIEWGNYEIKLDHAGSKGLRCTVSPKGMNSFPIHWPILEGHVNPPLIVDSTTLQVSSYYQYPNPENKEEQLYGINLNTINEGYMPSGYIQMTDSKPQEAALAFAGYFWWLKQEEDLLLMEKPSYDVPFAISNTKQTFHFEDGYSLVYDGSIVSSYEFTEEVAYTIELKKGEETERITFSTEAKELGPIRTWKDLEVELLKMTGMKGVNIVVRKKD